MEEFKKVLFQMQSDKAPGSDGLDSAFYKHFWHTGVLQLNTGEFSKKLMDTNIVLVPHKDN